MAKAFNGFKRKPVFAFTFQLSAHQKLATFHWLLLLLQLILLLHNPCNNTVKALPLAKAQHLIDHLITKQSLAISESSGQSVESLLNPETESPPPSVTNVIHKLFKSSPVNDQVVVDLTESRPNNNNNNKTTTTTSAIVDIETLLLNHHQIEHHQSDHQSDHFHNLISENFKLKVHFALRIIIRVSIFVYCCLVIGYLCDEYFVPSLENIGEALSLPSDLIGAILIPLGTSGPEIFSSAIGVFFAENDIGTGAIIGSGVFNILAIPAASGLAASYFLGDSIKLDKGPVLRDLTFYFISIIVLILAIKDNTVDFVDSTLFTILFVVYIGVMFYNVQGKQNDSDPKKADAFEKNKDDRQPEMINNAQNNHHQSKNGSMVTNHLPNNLTINNNFKTDHGGKMKEHLNKCNEIMMVNEKEPFLHQVAKLYDIEDSRSFLNDYFIEQNKNFNGDKLEQKFMVFIEDIINRTQDKCHLDPPRSKMHYEKLNDLDDNGVGFTENLFLRILLMPFILVYSITMPLRFPWITFGLSIMWLTILSYVTVWSIGDLSDLIGIPSVVSGMTILAAGSAVPDLVTSIIVIKKTGQASMGICAAIASNIFAILLGLGLPWAFQFMFRWIKTGNYQTSLIALQSSSLPYTAMLLLATVALLYVTLRLCQWKISKCFSMICFVLHILFIICSILLEIFIKSNS